MASLPNKSFVFNYNARDYIASTHTIPKTSGQTLDMDMVWTGTTSVINNIVFDEDHITIPVSGFSTFNFSSSGANPMNNTASEPAMTIVAKFKYNTSSAGSNFFNNRDATTYNYFARCGYDTSQGVGFLSLGTLGGANGGPVYDVSQPVIASWRVNSSRSIDIKNITSGTSATIGTTTWNGGTQWFTFFIWKKKTTNTINTTNYGEWMGGDFYWCYATREALTDEEIQQVVRYNESSFGPSSSGGTVGASGGTLTSELDSDTGWTVSTKPYWVTVSPASGESGTTTITFTVKKNNFASRTGVVVFTNDAGDTAEYTIEQGGTDGLVPFEKMYRNERRIN